MRASSNSHAHRWLREMSAQPTAMRADEFVLVDMIAKRAILLMDL